MSHIPYYDQIGALYSGIPAPRAKPLKLGDDRPNTTYKVKSWPAFFQAIKRGDKLHDMRDLRDRKYRVGDRLILQEYDPFTGSYTGDECTVEITYVTSADTPCAFSSAALAPGYCILSLRLV